MISGVISAPLEAANRTAVCLFDQLYQWRESNCDGRVWLCSDRQYELLLCVCVRNRKKINKLNYKKNKPGLNIHGPIIFGVLGCVSV